MPNLSVCPDCGRQVSTSAAACPQCGRPFRPAFVTHVVPQKKPDVISKIATFGCLGFLGFFAFTVLMGFLSKGLKPSKPDPAAVTPQGVVESERPVSYAGSTKPVKAGDCVELIGPRQGAVRLGSEQGGFMVSIAETAEVIRIGDDRQHVDVKVTKGNWNGREGHIPLGQVRPCPSAFDLAGNLKMGMSLRDRRDAYASINYLDSIAEKAAEKQLPIDQIPDDDPNGYMSRHKAYAERMVDEGRERIFDQFHIDSARLDQIEAEGLSERWPVFGAFEDRL